MAAKYLRKLGWIALASSIALFSLGCFLLTETQSPYVGVDFASGANRAPACFYIGTCPSYFRFFTITNATFAASMVTLIVTVWAFVVDRRIKLNTEDRDAQRFAWEQDERARKAEIEKQTNKSAK
ncbi:hypothetical protein [uncultured Aliiroseovarius sp.]|uniref:hypothetical protein n=1 Tax=uncultured Aliiroseovarius sp. TaxID=1658783 RepID=UPI0026056E47|nr:hypothetical protein [uncultured Aliiroseovarius sp.]